MLLMFYDGVASSSNLFCDRVGQTGMRTEVTFTANAFINSYVEFINLYAEFILRSCGQTGIRTEMPHITANLFTNSYIEFH